MMSKTVLLLVNGGEYAKDVNIYEVKGIDVERKINVTEVRGTEVSGLIKDMGIGNKTATRE